MRVPRASYIVIEHNSARQVKACDHLNNIYYASKILNIFGFIPKKNKDAETKQCIMKPQNCINIRDCTHTHTGFKTFNCENFSANEFLRPRHAHSPALTKSIFYICLCPFLH